MNLNKLLPFIFLSLFSISEANAQQHSVAREWNEILLTAIRNDFARPTVHARNLWHTSIVMYDAWAVYEENAENYFLGKSLHGFNCPFNGIAEPADKQAAQEEAMSYAAYRLLKHRFQNSPGAFISFPEIDTLFLFQLGYDSSFHSTNYSTGSAAALGNHLAEEMIAFGLQDGSNEQNDYGNTYYNTVNPPLLPMLPGNPDIVDPNRWQPLTLNVFIDQAGNVFPINTPSFLSPEWGDVVPFALDSSVMVTVTRDGDNYNIYHNVVNPPRIDTSNGGQDTEDYKWGFRLVSKWSAHLDTTDGVMIDASPNSIGNVPWYPSTIDSLPYFFDEDNGGDNSLGHAINPVTGQAYATQMVHRADYTRVLAEFWADGPDSETPPGHWFTILNYVNDHPQFEKRWKGQGPILDNLEWDVKSYFTLSGTVHDAAVAAWALKGYEDYIRPVSAIRYMCDQGQSTDPTLPNYSINGIQLDTGFVELVDSTDALAGSNYEHVGKIKLYAWEGPDSINNPAVDMAGVGWILAENWWPYQRPSFVTPPFAGFVSGHSTFSRAAADVMTAMTGTPYFPGGMGEFIAPKNDFLVFEQGPSDTVRLQWATYRDASDQCSLSRIWGGIHPPADDIPGRLLGMEIAVDAYELARSHWDNSQPDVIDLSLNQNVFTDADAGNHLELTILFDENMDTTITPSLSFPQEDPSNSLTFSTVYWSNLYTCHILYSFADVDEEVDAVNIRISGGTNLEGSLQVVYDAADLLWIDSKNPSVLTVSPSVDTIGAAQLGNTNFLLDIQFDEAMDTNIIPNVNFPVEDPLAASLSYNATASYWISSDRFIAIYDVLALQNLMDIDVQVDLALDSLGNSQLQGNLVDNFSIFNNIESTNLLEEASISLLPNPLKAGQAIQIQLQGISGVGSLELYDVQGRLLLSQNWENLNLIQLPSNQLEAGQYLLKFQTEAGSFQKKLVIKN